MTWILFFTGLLIVVASFTEARGKVAILAVVATFAIGVGTMVTAIYLRSIGL